MDEEKAEMIAALIASEASPFSNEDKDGLEAMAEDTLKKMMEGYATPEANAEEEEPEANEEQEEPKANALSDEDKAALEFARNQYREHRKSLVSKITANSAMREKQLADMNVAQLEVIANGLASAAPDYSGRGVANQRNENSAKAEIIKAMTVQNLGDLVKAKNGGKA